MPPAAGPVIQAPSPALHDRIAIALAPHIPLHRGTTWTTDAPYRETAAAIAAATAHGLLAVEMEAAALYAFAHFRGVAVTCFAHVTNSMGQDDAADFEKGEASGVHTALHIIAAVQESA